MNDRDHAVQLGRNAHQRLQELEINWDTAVSKLLA